MNLPNTPAETTGYREISQNILMKNDKETLTEVQPMYEIFNLVHLSVLIGNWNLTSSRKPQQTPVRPSLC